MELIIILLIAVELVIVSTGSFFVLWYTCAEPMGLQCLIRDGPELWEMAFGPEPQKKGSNEHGVPTAH